MCRFVVYTGAEIFIAELLTRPENSLIKQSYKAKKRSEPLNGDGFGVGWYAPQVDSTPCLFTSITPAWSNQNLHRLAEKISSSSIFAHVRAASPGMLVSEVNCHPFQYGRFLWMHNGAIAQFSKIKRRLRQSLSDELYNFIQGTSDSEHAFAVFLNQISDHLSNSSADELTRAMVATIHQLNKWSDEAGITEPSYYNFAVTDGQTVVATRYVTIPSHESASLYFSSGTKFECHEGVCRMVQAEQHEHAVIVTSEPLTDVKQDWKEVPNNHLIVITPELKIRLLPIPVRNFDVSRRELSYINSSTLYRN
jgi:ergothioneine biosynthesis protein EgtC